MSKNYLCKDCIHNNNGWCKQFKKQGLKEVTICKHHNNKNSEKAKFNTFSNSKEEISEKKLNEMLSNNSIFAKRYLLWFMQKQFVGAKRKYGELTEEHILSIFNMMEEHLSITEEIQGFSLNNLDSEVDKDIYRGTKEFYKLYVKK